MRKCPRCGEFLDEDLNACLNCGWHNNKNRKRCPKCGDTLERGVCYRCGYRSRKAMDTCPYCGQKLIKGFCDRCNYKRGDGIWYIIIAIAAAILLFNIIL